MKPKNKEFVMQDRDLIAAMAMIGLLSNIGCDANGEFKSGSILGSSKYVIAKQAYLYADSLIDQSKKTTI